MGNCDETKACCGPHTLSRDEVQRCKTRRAHYDSKLNSPRLVSFVFHVCVCVLYRNCRFPEKHTLLATRAPPFWVSYYRSYHAISHGDWLRLGVEVMEKDNGQG